MNKGVDMINEDTKTFLKFNSEGMDQYQIFKSCREKAIEALDIWLNDWRKNTGGNKYDEPMYCGFANVKIKPAKGKFVKFLKECGIGGSHTYGGYRVSYHELVGKLHPKARTQSMDLKEVACDAFANELKKYGITVFS